MATKTSINIAEVDSNGKVINRAVTDINPDATNAQITAFANGINGLTTNDYGGTTKITKEEIVSLPSPNLTLSKSALQDSEIPKNDFGTVNVTFNGNGKITVENAVIVSSAPDGKPYYIGWYNESDKKIYIESTGFVAWGGQTYEMKVHLSSDGTYAAESATITITCPAN